MGEIAQGDFVIALGERDLHGDTLVVCATSRLAQALQQQQARAMVLAGRAQWTPLQALTFDQWLERIQIEVSLQGLSEAPALLALPMDSVQERLLWERIIREDLEERCEFLFDVAALAKTAMEAHQLSIVWGVQAKAHQLTEESRRFAGWQRRFLAECRERSWIDKHSLQQALLDALPTCFDRLQWPKRVAFAGHTRLNPAERKLRSLLQLRGIELLEWSSAASTGADAPGASVTCLSYPDTAAEALAAALWAQQRWHADPQARLAIVVPDLALSRHLLEDTLDDVLMPMAICPGQAEAARPYNISLGMPLSHKPLVHTALALLQWLVDADKLSQAAVSPVLRSPYWSDAQKESAARALLEAAMRERLPPSANFEHFRQDLHRQSGSGHGRHLQAPELLRHLDQLAQALPGLQAARLPSRWAQDLPTLLQRGGWLFQRKLSSHEFQAKEALLDTIEQLARLDEWMGPVPYGTIVSQLRRACADRTFQVQTEGQPRLQVLGVLESSGLSFDGVWVMGMVDTAWPPAARPNALLPSELQRQAQSPNAGAAVQLEFAQALQAHWMHCTPELVFSWPRQLGDAKLSPSPLIPVTAEQDHLPCPASPHWSWQAANRPDITLAPPLVDVMAPPVAPGERVRGGTWMLRAQAICPAWAYYQYRLGAQRLEKVTEGLDARQRGTFLHDAMEHFWKGVKTSQRLKALNHGECEGRVRAAVDQVLKAYNEDPGNTALKPRFAELERARLVRLITGWLELERSRAHDFEVMHTEKECALEIEGLPVRMFIDRIDQLADGSTLVIDYKTGANIDTKNWASDRLTEPQLPIYASIARPDEGPVHGVLFAKVLMNDPSWAGLSKDDKLLPKVTGLPSTKGRKLFPEERFPHWASVLEHWSERIRAVAMEVKDGHAGVRFADPKALEYCDVLPLLRVSERQSQLEAASRNAAGDEDPGQRSGPTP